MKIFLDDCRLCPKDYVGVKSVEDFEKLVLDNRECIDEISLDYDLSGSGSGRTGLAACDFLIKQKIPCKKIIIHSDHPTAAEMYDFIVANKPDCEVVMEKYSIMQVMKGYDEG